MDPNVVALFAFCASALGDALVVGATRGVFARAAEALPDGGRALRRLKGLAGDEKSRFCNGIEKELLESAGKAFSGSEGIRVDRRALRRAKRQITHIIKRAKPEDYAALAKARTPEAIEQVLRRLPRKWGRGIREEDRQWFDELVGAVAREYTILAPWSPTFQVRALDAILDKLEAIHDVTTDNGRKLDELLARPALVAADGAGAGRVVFGARPDVAAGFVERGEQQRLRGLVVDGTQERVVLVGMAGCGKSQLASSLARECGAAGWGLVAWLNASSKDSVRGDLVELARRLGVDTSDNPTQDQAIERCLDHLQSAEASDRLVVFDNVEDFDDLTDVVPRGGGLRVVATARSGRGWGAQGWKTVAVGVFPREESVAYLLDAAGSQDAEAADAVARRLGDLPLAVAQAAATASDEEWTLKRYLERLEKYSSRQVIRPVPGDSYTRDVSSALRMAVDSALGRIDDRLRGVARLQIGALAVLAESGVPTRWIDPLADEERAGEDTGAGAAGEDADALNSAEDAHLALTALTKASVVQKSAGKRVTMLHRLQGQVLRENWNPGEWAGAFDAAADLLDRVNVGSLPREDAEGRRREAHDLIEQLRAIAAQDYSHPLFERERVVADLPHVLFHARDLGLPNEALTLRGAVGVVEGVLGAEHPDSLASRNSLAAAYQAAGRLGEAIPLYEQVLADSVRVLGEDHPSTLASRNNLAGAYQAAGRLGEAIALYEGVLADRVRVLGADHPHTLTSRGNLAAAYESAGRLGEAIPLFEGVLADRVRVLGEDHPSTLASRNNLAGAYQAAGCLGEAIALYEGVLADRVRVLGDDHPHTLTSRGSLAGAYESAGRLGEAIPLFEGVLADRVRVLGADHPDTLTSRGNLAAAYESAGRLGEAIPLYEEVLADRVRVLGDDHPDTLTSRGSLAGAYESAGRLGEAIPLFEGVLADRVRVLGADHPDTLTSRGNLAAAYESAGRLGEAIPLYEEVLADRVRVLGDDHPDTLTSRGSLAAAYESAGRLGEAIPLYEQVLADYVRVLGADHPHTLTSRNNLAYAYQAAGRLGEAIPLYEKVLVDQVQVLGPDHPDTLISRNNLAYAYYSAGRLDEAIPPFEKVLADSVRVLGADHPHTLTSRGNLAHAYQAAGRLDEAIPLHEQVLADSARVLGADHPHTLTSRNNLAHAYQAAERLDEAIPLYEKVAADSVRVLGPDHPHTLTSRGNLAHAYQAAGRLDEAIPLHEQVLADSARVLGADHPHTLTSRNNLAHAYQAAGHHHEAINLFKDTLEVCEEALSPDHPLTIQVRRNLKALEREMSLAPASSPESSEE